MGAREIGGLLAALADLGGLLAALAFGVAVVVLRVARSRARGGDRRTKRQRRSAVVFFAFFLLVFALGVWLLSHTAAPEVVPNMRFAAVVIAAVGVLSLLGYGVGRARAPRQVAATREDGAESIEPD